MEKENLRNWIREAKKRGMPDGQITKYLVDHGINEDLISEELFSYNSEDKQEEIRPITIEKGGKKKLLLFIMVPLALILLVVLAYFLVPNSQSISETELSSGINLEIKLNEELQFMLGEEEHSINVDSINSNSVSLTIQSEPIKISLTIGEEEKIDLDNDGFYDLRIKLNSITEEISDFHIKKINEEISLAQDETPDETPDDNQTVCQESWQCSDWSDCITSNGNSNEIRICVDSNFCNTTNNLPEGYRSCSNHLACISNEDCTDYESNEMGLCFLGGLCQYYEYEGDCRLDSDCSLGCQNCSNSNGVCKWFSTGSTVITSCVECIYGSDCLEGYSCNTENQCVIGSSSGQPCSTTSDCFSGEYCPFGSSVCIPRKEIDSECSMNYECLSNLCVDVCVEENFYEQFSTCTPLADPCQESCSNCVDGIYSCIITSDYIVPVCVECMSDSGCNSGYKCFQLGCIPE